MSHAPQFEAVKSAYQKTLALMPTRLPIGMTEFESWASSIIQTYGFPDNDSLRFALATMIVHMPSNIDRRSKHSFAVAIRKSMANQIAGAVMQDLKLKQQQEIEKQKQIEASKETASEESVSISPV